MDELNDKFQIRQNGQLSVTVRGYSGPAPRRLTIPAKINDVSVTVIDKRAFKFAGLFQIQLPPTIECIEEEAFAKNSLEEVILYPAVSSVSMAAFYKNMIRHLVIPPGLKRIENFCFFGNQLEQITLPDSLLYLGMLTFAENPLKEIIIGSGLTFDRTVEAIPGFDHVYDYNGKKAGRYVLIDGKWTYSGN
ncbi:MAG: leucine-rich repeat domain-containing protein [Treponema sp.]|jgi:hypothetical protein|nr:leucine-rich repeat domain-containing protein [Treponema sp.]